MTDRYARIREALAMGPTRNTIRALLDERDALRDALEMMLRKMVEMKGFGKAYAMSVARAALAHGGEG